MAGETLTKTVATAAIHTDQLGLLPGTQKHKEEREGERNGGRVRKDGCKDIRESVGKKGLVGERGTSGVKVPFPHWFLICQ